ncbi:uncharacterized protein METZ01_LOCUS411563, partial [marine metagenome]
SSGRYWRSCGSPTRTRPWPSPTTRFTGWPPGSGRPTWRAASAWPSASRPARSTSTTTSTPARSRRWAASRPVATDARTASPASRSSSRPAASGLTPAAGPGIRSRRH